MRYLVLGAHPIENPSSGSAIRTRQHVEVLGQKHNVRYFHPHRPDWGALTTPQKIAHIPRIADPRFDPYANYLHGQERRAVALALLHRPHTLVVSEHYMIRYALAVKKALPNVWVVFDAHNHDATLHKQISSPLRARLAKTNEDKMLSLCDELWVCSPDDARLFDIPHRVIPNGIDGPLPQSPGNPHNIGYIGGYDYLPNLTAARHLTHTILPRLPPQFRLSLAGKHPHPTMHGDRVMVEGFIEDIDAWASNIGVMCMPITQGGGTRLKVVEALSRGIPIVATKKAVEGLPVIDGTHCLIRNIEDMPDAIERLASNRLLRDHIIKKGLELARTYHWENMSYD